MTHPVATLPKLTVKELAALKAIDASEYGEFLTDDIWSFSICDNIPNSAGINRTSVPGIVASLQKKGYTRSGESDGQKTVRMTREGALAYVAANGGVSKKFIDHDTAEAAREAALATAAAEAEVGSADERDEAYNGEAPTQLQVDTRRVAAKAKKTAEEKRLAKNARAARRRAARKAANETADLADPLVAQFLAPLTGKKN